MFRMKNIECVHSLFESNLSPNLKELNGKVAFIFMVHYLLFAKVLRSKEIPKATYTIWVGTTPIGFAKKGNLSADKNQSYHSSCVWSMECKKDFERTSVEFILKLHKTFGGEIEAGRIQLPLKWFPVNQVVTDWFPIYTNHSSGISSHKMLLQIQIHLADSKVEPFSAPAGSLLVLPAWDRPGIPAVPPLPPGIPLAPSQSYQYSPPPSYNQPNPPPYMPQHNPYTQSLPINPNQRYQPYQQPAYQPPDCSSSQSFGFPGYPSQDGIAPMYVPPPPDTVPSPYSSSSSLIQSNPYSQNQFDNSPVNVYQNQSASSLIVPQPAQIPPNQVVYPSVPEFK